MRERLQFVIGVLKPKQLNVLLEAHWYNNGQMGYHDSPYLRALGKNWDVEAYNLAAAVAKENGLTPGKDIFFYYNDRSLDKPDYPLDLVFARLLTLKQSGVPIHGVGIQVYPDDNVTKDQLVTAIKRMSQIGEVYLEFGVWDEHGKDKTSVKKSFEMTVAACLEINAANTVPICSSILIWDDGFKPKNGRLSPFYTDKLEPSLLYSETLKNILTTQ